MVTESHKLTEDTQSLEQGSCSVSLSPHLLKILGVGAGDCVTFTVENDGRITVAGQRRDAANNDHAKIFGTIPVQDTEQLTFFDPPAAPQKHRRRKQ